MSHWDIKYERIGLEGWEVREFTNSDNVKFLIKEAYEYVVDDYDPYIASVEQSHHESLGYSTVRKFEYLGEGTIDTLDLTWMRKQDCFKLEYNEQYENITIVKANIDNLDCSHLPRKKEKDKDIDLIVYGDETSLRPLKQIRIFKRFIKRNQPKLNSIKLEGFKPLMTQVLTNYANRLNIEVKDNEKSKTLKLKR